MCQASHAPRDLTAPTSHEVTMLTTLASERLPPLYCPHCSTRLDDVSPLAAASVAPMVGDWSLCCECLSVLRFAPGPNGSLWLRSTTLAERSGPDAPDDLDHYIALLSCRSQRH
jgi:hypothetical protein